MRLRMQGTGYAVARLRRRVMVVLRREDKLQQEDNDEQPWHQPAAHCGMLVFMSRGVAHPLPSA